MKFYTDIEQSKKLAEILPLESADMSYAWDFDDERYYINIGKFSNWRVPKYAESAKHKQVIPCWSLSALMDVLPYPSIHKHADETWWCDAWVDKVNPYSLRHFKTPVDACVAMIEELHEQKLL